MRALIRGLVFCFRFPVKLIASYVSKLHFDFMTSSVKCTRFAVIQLCLLSVLSRYINRIVAS